LQQPCERTTLSQWLHYLEHSQVEEIQLGLTRIKLVAEDLGLLTPACPVITVAGTNGKGSTVAALESLYQAAGYQVGTYTSPHLHQFNERIRINGTPISDDDLCKAFSVIEKNRGLTPLTYFEVATLSALWYFNAHSLDIIILEVGLGGRLDATNIIDSTVSIITTIAFDHEAFLGHTLDAIGYEKAGIMRQDKPCIYADINPPDSIKNQADRIKVPLLCFDRDYQIQPLNDTFKITWQDKSWTLPKPSIQLQSAAAALMAVTLLQDRLPVTMPSMQNAMKNIAVSGRLELLKGAINVLLDVSHNPQAAQLLAHYVKQISAKRVHAVFSALEDKDVTGLIAPLKDCVDHWYPAQLNTRRAASLACLQAIFTDLHIKTTGYANPKAAFESAKIKANTGDLIIVYGSFFTVAAIRAQITREYNENFS